MKCCSTQSQGALPAELLCCCQSLIPHLSRPNPCLTHRSTGSCPFSIQTIPVSCIFHCFWHLYAECDLISMLESSGQGWEDSAGFSPMVLAGRCPALCDSEICSYWQGMAFLRGTFGPVIFTFCSGKTLSRATQMLVSHWAQSWGSYGTTQITAFWEATKTADTIQHV